MSNKQKANTPEQKVWTLTITEYEGQCTGFSSYVTLLAIFTKEPSPAQLAPYLGNHLSSTMGEAISQVISLIDTGRYAPSDRYDFDLNHVICNTPIEEK
jgi:hypothetical protein